ncbi:hypothetical protein C8R47DRAFT_229150 [Mycena vitilis]|nr:hypothetical protein C8R47DRAFT_229150 [Mycena vitilis]
MSLLVRCDCPKCKGRNVPRSTRTGHQERIGRALSHGSSSALISQTPALRPADYPVPPLPLALTTGLPAATTSRPEGFSLPPDFPPHLTPTFASATFAPTFTPSFGPSFASTFAVPTFAPDLPWSTAHFAGQDPLFLEGTVPVFAAPADSYPPFPPLLPPPTFDTSFCERVDSENDTPVDQTLPARVRRLPKSSQARALATMVAAERRGRAAIKAARAIADDLSPIADVDWEDSSEEEEEPDNAPESTAPHAEDDIFRVPSAPAMQLPTAADVHPHPSAYILYLLVLWLHMALHLPFRGCNVVLVVVGQLLRAAQVVVDPPLLKTLPAVLDHLGAEPSFQVLPACPTCFELFPASSPPLTECARCSVPIFRPIPSTARTPGATPKPKPRVSFPTKSIEEQLKDMLSVPGVEDEMDLWREKARKPGVYEDFFDGLVSKEIEGPDGLPFFRSGASPTSAPDNELRVGLTLGVDW